MHRIIGVAIERMVGRASSIHLMNAAAILTLIVGPGQGSVLVKVRLQEDILSGIPNSSPCTVHLCLSLSIALLATC